MEELLWPAGSRNVVSVLRGLGRIRHWSRPDLSPLQARNTIASTICQLHQRHLHQQYHLPHLLLMYLSKSQDSPRFKSRCWFGRPPWSALRPVTGMTAPAKIRSGARAHLHQKVCGSVLTPQEFQLTMHGRPQPRRLVLVVWRSFGLRPLSKYPTLTHTTQALKS